MIDYLFGFFGAFYGGKSYQLAVKQIKSNAISTLRNAVRLTIDHIDKTRQGEFGGDNFSDSKSDELRNLWSLAANAIRPISPDWAKVFEEKSDYWENPVGFRFHIQNHQRRFDYRFRLTEVLNKLNELESNF